MLGVSSQLEDSINIQFKTLISLWKLQVAEHSCP